MNRQTLEAIKVWARPGGAVQFVRDVFDVEPDAWQVDFLEAYQSKKRVAAKACKGPGKTAVLAWCCWHYMVCHQYSKIIATSITGDNLRDGLWSELAKWQHRSKLLQAMFTWHAERIIANESPENWFMSARKWSQSSDSDQQSNALAGLHADDIMFVIDEAGGVPDAVMAAAEAALSNAGTEVNPNATAKLLICGNPTHLSGPLYRACTAEANLWHVIEITGDPDDPKRSPRISIEWAKAMIAKYGRDNPWVLVNVFGKFPPSSINGLLGPDEVQAAMTRVLDAMLYQREPKVLGGDIGGGGQDPSVIMPRWGQVYFQPRILRLDDPKMIAAQFAQAAKKFDPDMIFIDDTGGWGRGVISYLRDWGYAVTGVGFASKPTDNQYENKRTEMLYEFALDVKNGACLPNIPALKAACVAQEYTFKKDKILMLPKDELKEGISDTVGFDILDAAALTRAFPVARRNPYHDENTKRQQSYNPITGRSDQIGVNLGHQFKDSDYNPLGTAL